jgi:hypothetical protein
MDDARFGIGKDFVSEVQEFLLPGNAAAIAECRRMGIDVRPPDVHRSEVEFTVEGDAIRIDMGLNHIAEVRA